MIIIIYLQGEAGVHGSKGPRGPKGRKVSSLFVS